MTVITIYPIVNICLWQELENTKVVQRVLSNRKGDMDIRKLTAARIAFCFIVMGISLFIKDEYFLILLSGSVFGPAFGILVPVS